MQQRIQAGLRSICLAFALAALPPVVGSAQSVDANVDADALARFQQGIRLAEQKQTESALGVFEQLTRDYPGWPEPWNNLAVLYASRGEEKKAEAALLAALRTHPSYALIYRNLNSLYAGIAERAYRKALESGEEIAEPPKLALATQAEPPRVDTAPAPVAQQTGDERTVSETPVKTSPSQDQAAAPRDAEAEPEPGPVRVAGVLADPLEAPLTRTRAPAATDAAGTAPTPEKEVLDAVGSWIDAWSSQDVEAYLGFYGRNFDPGNGVSRARWEEIRRLRVSTPSFIDVRIDEPQVRLESGDRAVVRFLQQYRSNTFEGRTWKTLHMSRGSSGWKIIRERTGS